MITLVASWFVKRSYKPEKSTLITILAGFSRETDDNQTTKLRMMT